MKDSINIEGRTLISARRAAEMAKYSNDYIGQLCRSGKVQARMIGRSWYVDQESLVEHQKKAEILSQARGYKNIGVAPTMTPAEPLLLKKVAPLKYYSDDRPLLPVLKVKTIAASKISNASENTALVKPVIIKAGEVKRPVKLASNQVISAVSNRRHVKSDLVIPGYGRYLRLALFAIVLLVSLGYLNSIALTKYGGNPMMARLSMIENRAVDLAKVPFAFVGNGIRSIAGSDSIILHPAEQSQLATASAWDSVVSALDSFTGMVRNGTRAFLGIRDIEPTALQTTLAVKTDSTQEFKTATSTTIVERTIEPRTTMIRMLRQVRI
jgi:hypothetical protein